MVSTQKYINLKNKFDIKFRQEFFKYKAKIELEVTKGKRGSSYFAIKKLGLRPGEISHPEFQLPEHANHKISPAESAEMLADYFSAVSQEYQPLDVNKLPPNMETYLATNAMLSQRQFFQSQLFSKSLSSQRSRTAQSLGIYPKR